MIKNVILSRKGFDSDAGGIPSPIYKNKLISIPIPEVNSGIKYDDLIFDENDSYLKLLLDLNKNYFTECHSDPDLYKELYPRIDWLPVFGQSGGAASRLKDVDKDSLFLFYGWFREIEKRNGKYQYIKTAPDIHCIYGYLVVKEVLSAPNDKEKISKIQHPHSISSKFEKLDYLNAKNNKLFIGTEFFPDFGKRGYGYFNFNENLVLTDKKSKNRSTWSMPLFFLKENIRGYKEIEHTEANVIMQFIGRNHQELIISESDEIKVWAMNLIKNSITY